jgi:hypothetical protein
MNVKQQTPLTREVQPLPAEWGRLIQKLRWIGLAVVVAALIVLAAKYVW